LNSQVLISKSKSQYSKISRRISLAILMTVLSVGGMNFAQTAVAQDAPQATTQPAKPTGKSQSPLAQELKAEKKSEAEEVNEYRHSASVQWFAKLLNVDVETAAKIFEWINFAVILLAVGIPLIRIIPGAMRKRTAKLNVDLEQAKAETLDAQERLRAVETKLAGLDAEIAAIRKQVEDEMRSDEERIKNSVTEETARIVASAEQEIQMAASQAQRGLKDFVADIVIERALSQLTLTAETDHALISEFASDVAGGRGKRKGGQN
jgi:F-type H+-transporting ATPase subunit b